MATATYVWQSFDKSNVEVVLDFGHPLPQIVLEEILELAGKFNTRGTTANHHHME